MTSHILSSLYSGLLPFSGTIDFSNLPLQPKKSDILKKVRASVNSVQFDRIKKTESSTYDMAFVTLEDTGYPSVLRRAPFAPPVLFYKGNLDLLDHSSVAIVGSRHCSKDSISFTSRVAWASHGSHTIIGGLTYGIEEAAQQAILTKKSSSLQLIGVLEQGFDNIKGSRKRWMEKVLERDGLILSAYPPKQRVQKWYYKERNRLIAALSDIIILVEASKTSGAMSTAIAGVELGKDVYAVPHHPNRVNGHGCLKLIEEGAHPLWDPVSLFGNQTPEHALLKNLNNPKSLEEISETQHIPPSDMLETLLELKRLGYVRQRGSLWERL